MTSINSLTMTFTSRSYGRDQNGYGPTLDTLDARVFKIAVLGAQIIHDTLRSRHPGKDPRASNSRTASIELVADDVHQAATRLSAVAMDKLAAHIRNTR